MSTLAGFLLVNSVYRANRSTFFAVNASVQDRARNRKRPLKRQLDTRNRARNLVTYFGSPILIIGHVNAPATLSARLSAASWTPGYPR